MKSETIKLQDLYRARKRIAGVARRTPLVPSEPLSERVNRNSGSGIGPSVWLKLENLQETGAFKVRGAANRLLSLTDAEKERGVIAFSTGNHGRAVAYVARSLGIRAVVCLSERVPAYRVQAMEQLGAAVVQKGKSQDAAYEHALALQKEEELTMVGPFDDPFVIAGQGTIGIEILEDLPDTDTVIVPVSGGGLMAGIALAIKSANPDIRVVGVSMEVGAAMYASIRAGKPVAVEEKDSLADALLGGIGLDNRYTFPMIRDYVDELLLVTEEEIAQGMAFAFHNHRMMIEGAAAVGISALLSGVIETPGKEIAVVVSGGNVDPDLLCRIASEEKEKVT